MLGKDNNSTKTPEIKTNNIPFMDKLHHGKLNPVNKLINQKINNSNNTPANQKLFLNIKDSYSEKINENSISPTKRNNGLSISNATDKIDSSQIKKENDPKSSNFKNSIPIHAKNEDNSNNSSIIDKKIINFPEKDSENLIIDGENITFINVEPEKENKLGKNLIVSNLSKNINEKKLFRNSSKSIVTVSSVFSDLNGDEKRNHIKLTLNVQNNNSINNIVNNPNSFNSSVYNNNMQYNILEHEDIRINQINKFESDTFCDMYFLVGLQPKKVRIISDSENYIPPCKHKNCGILNSYRPEILEFFPLTNNDGIELNTTVFLIIIIFLYKIFLFFLRIIFFNF